MELTGKRIGFVLTGSFCTFSITIPKIKELIKNGADVIPVMSYNSYNLDTKFGKAQDFINQIEEITNKKIIHTIQDAEPIGPKKMTDLMIVAPCSGNTMAKLANDIIDRTKYYGSKCSHMLMAGKYIYIFISKEVIEIY